jgi:hypothetical protein
MPTRRARFLTHLSTGWPPGGATRGHLHNYPTRRRRDPQPLNGTGASDEGPVPKGQLRAIRADLEAIGAAEIASILVMLPKSPQRVEWQGFRLWVAADVGLFVYEATPGWAEPHETPEGQADAWGLAGSFRTWAQFTDLSVTLTTGWDERRGARVPRRTISGAQSWLNLPEPPQDWSPPGSDQPAWRDFARACIELSARAAELQPPEATGKVPDA